jgi:DNA-directed RNA polymerase subunit RPC12/RpoP
MSESTYFLQECPTCGRSLQIRVEYLGREVICQHCRGRLMAHDGATAGPVPEAAPVEVLQRVDELLDMAEHRRWRPR